MPECVDQNDDLWIIWISSSQGPLLGQTSLVPFGLEVLHMKIKMCK